VLEGEPLSQGHLFIAVRILLIVIHHTPRQLHSSITVTNNVIDSHHTHQHQPHIKIDLYKIKTNTNQINKLQVNYF
jgi:hypothetical protein